MRKVTTFFLATCVAAAFANAGVMVNVIQNADPAVGVNSFTVQLVGTEGANVSTISGFELTGAHQVWENPAGNGDTPRAGDTNGTFGNPAWGAFDTHIMAIPGFNSSPNWTPVETNDGSNPAGISLAPGNPAFAAFPGTAGIGSLRFTDSSNPAQDLQSGIAFLAPQPSTVDFLQVVVPAGQMAMLNMILEDSTTAQTVVENLMIGGGGTGGDGPDLGPGGAVDFIFNGEIQTLTLTNSGDETASLAGFEITGDNADLFSLVAPDLSDIAAGASREFMVRFGGDIPNERATYTAQLTFDSNADVDPVFALTANVPEPSTVALAGLALVGLVGFARRK